MPKSSETKKIPFLHFYLDRIRPSRRIPHIEGFCEESIFHEKLIIERQRTDRSGRPFLLILTNVESLLNGNNGNKEKDIGNLENKLIAGIHSLTRQTDISGWFVQKEVIGIIYTEIDPEKLNLIRECLLHRINNQLAGILKPELLREVHISFHLYPMDFDEEKYSFLKLYSYSGVNGNRRSKSAALWFKRIFDIVGSICGLILFSPCFILFPALIKITSPGPVFFRQNRLGLHGKPFVFLKFRTMTADNDASVHREYIKALIENNLPAASESSPEGKQVYKIQNDPRITRIGSFLRKTSLDELPQFINVLKGEMSLIGPRPPIPYELEHYRLWHRRRIMEAKPGITGLWQIRGRSRCNFDDTVRLDLQYIREWSLWLDLKILLQTPWAMIAGKGGY